MGMGPDSLEGEPLRLKQTPSNKGRAETAQLKTPTGRVRPLNHVVAEGKSA
jgi:hypothetical protein